MPTPNLLQSCAELVCAQATGTLCCICMVSLGCTTESHIFGAQFALDGSSVVAKLGDTAVLAVIQGVLEEPRSQR